MTKYPSALAPAPVQFSLLNIQTELMKLTAEVMTNVENLAAEIQGPFPVAAMDKQDEPSGLASMLASGMKTQKEMLERINAHINSIRTSL